jgi:hypothetical protein
MNCSFLSEMTFFDPVIDEAEKQDLIAETSRLSAFCIIVADASLSCPKQNETDLRALGKA